MKANQAGLLILQYCSFRSMNGEAAAVADANDIYLSSSSEPGTVLDPSRWSFSTL